MKLKSSDFLIGNKAWGHTAITLLIYLKLEETNLKILKFFKLM